MLKQDSTIFHPAFFYASWTQHSESLQMERGNSDVEKSVCFDGQWFIKHAPVWPCLQGSFLDVTKTSEGCPWINELSRLLKKQYWGYTFHPKKQAYLYDNARFPAYVGSCCVCNMFAVFFLQIRFFSITVPFSWFSQNAAEWFCKMKCIELPCVFPNVIVQCCSGVSLPCFFQESL